MRNLVLSLVTMFVVLGCSNQWRNIDVSFSRAEVVNSLNEQSQYASSYTSGGYADYLFWQLVDSYSSTLYYAESSDYMGPVSSVLSFVDVSWLDPSGSTYSIYDLSDVKIYLLFDSASAPTTAALMVSYTSAYASGPMFRFLMAQAPPTIEGGKLTVNLMSDDGVSLQLQSRDVKNSDLNSVMQFQAFSSDGTTVLGKFSTLVKVD